MEEELSSTLLDRVKMLKGEREELMMTLVALEKRIEAYSQVLDWEESDSTTAEAENVHAERGVPLPKADRDDIEKSEDRNECSRVRFVWNLIRRVSYGVPQLVANALFRLKRRDRTLEINGRHYLKGYEQFLKRIQTAIPAKAGTLSDLVERLTATP